MKTFTNNSFNAFFGDFNYAVFLPPKLPTYSSFFNFKFMTYFPLIDFPKDNLLSLYNVACMYVLVADHFLLVLDQSGMLFPWSS